jgi:hypothetical protein
VMRIEAGKEQQELFCHARCLRRAMHRSVPLLVDDE